MLTIFHRSSAHSLVRGLLEADELEVGRYLQGMTNVYNPDEQLKVEVYLADSSPNQFLVVPHGGSYYLDIWRNDGDKRHHFGPFGYTQLREMKEKWTVPWMNYPVREDEEPSDTRSEVDRLLPTRQVRMRGNTMLNASGVIQFAQQRWRERSKAAKKNAMDIVKAWPGLTDENYLAILNGKCDIQTDGDDAVVTIRQY